MRQSGDGAVEKWERGQALGQQAKIRGEWISQNKMRDGFSLVALTDLLQLDTREKSRKRSMTRE